MMMIDGMASDCYDYYMSDAQYHYIKTAEIHGRIRQMYITYHKNGNRLRMVESLHFAVNYGPKVVERGCFLEKI
jgi:hypothetical protein